MTDRAERVLAIIASLLVIFSAMLDPRISLGLAVVVGGGDVGRLGNGSAGKPDRFGKTAPI